jgi:hypothetical protein
LNLPPERNGLFDHDLGAERSVIDVPATTDHPLGIGTYALA